MSLRQLRAIELVLFGMVSADMLIATHAGFLLEASYGDPGLVVSQWNLTALSFVLLMATYAIFVPNTWRRAALVVVPMALVPLGLVVEMQLRHPEVAGLAASVFTTSRTTDVILHLVTASAVCVLGTALITRFRTATFEARAAGLYDLREKIGVGGMGEVWRAEHHVLARPVAIKLIRPELVGADGDPEKARVATRRFEREAQATAALRSPNTIEVYDFGVTGEGVFFYVMEYLDGLDLETLVQEHGPLPASRAIYLLRQACASLGDAHTNGLIHRDVKPANIFACRLGQEHDFVKVLDFGLVKEEQRVDQTQLTVDGLTTGTPAYMAPVLALQDHPITPATDVYAIGCVAYWLVTGKLVFDNETPLATIVDHVKTEPTPPSARTELEVPAELDALILRCLAKDPGDRYASMRELSEALARVTLVGAAWTDRTADEWWRLHRPASHSTQLAKAA